MMVNDGWLATSNDGEWKWWWMHVRCSNAARWLRMISSLPLGRDASTSWLANWRTHSTTNRPKLGSPLDSTEFGYGYTRLGQQKGITETRAATDGILQREFGIRWFSYKHKQQNNDCIWCVFLPAMKKDSQEPLGYPHLGVRRWLYKLKRLSILLAMRDWTLSCCSESPTAKESAHV